MLMIQPLFHRAPERFSVFALMTPMRTTGRGHMALYRAIRTGRPTPAAPIFQVGSLRPPAGAAPPCPLPDKDAGR